MASGIKKMNITIDLDSKNPLRVGLALFHLWNANRTQKFWDNLLLRTSRSKGYHFRYFLHAPHDLNEFWAPAFFEFQLRLKCGDDWRRVYFDFSREGGGKKVLFTEGKIVHEGQTWKEIRCRDELRAIDKAGAGAWKRFFPGTLFKFSTKIILVDNVRVEQWGLGAFPKKMPWKCFQKSWTI